LLQVDTPFREYNLACRREILALLTALQARRIGDLQAELGFTTFPPSTFNPQREVQNAHDSLQNLARKRKSIDGHVNDVLAYLRKQDYRFVIFDLHLGLRSFLQLVGTRSVYAFFREIFKGHQKYPTVTQDSYRWLGEAKIHESYEWLLKGLKQLLGRYATGREDGPGLLVYIKGSNAQAVLDKWRRRIEAGNECDLKSTADADKAEKLAFWSIHTHKGSGLEIRTKHLGVSLYHKPTA